MSATYRIKELASGKYLLEMKVANSDNWIHVYEFDSLAAADFGMKRLITKPTWYFDELGEQLAGDNSGER